MELRKGKGEGGRIVALGLGDEEGGGGGTVEEGGGGGTLEEGEERGLRTP